MKTGWQHIMRRPLIITGILLAVVFVLWLTLMSSHRRTERPKVSVTFLGQRTNSAGTQSAMFAVTNLGGSAVIRGAGYWIQAPTTVPPNTINLSWNLDSSGRDARLQPGDSEILLVPVPANQPSWRVFLMVSYPESMPQQVVRDSLDWANISRRSFGISSGWVDK